MCPDFIPRGSEQPERKWELFCSMRKNNLSLWKFFVFILDRQDKMKYNTIDSPQREIIYIKKKKKKTTIRNKSGTKSKTKIAHSGYFIWIYFGKKMKTRQTIQTTFLYRWFCKIKQCWNALFCLITNSLMTVIVFNSFIVSLKMEHSLTKYIWFSFISFHNTANENSFIFTNCSNGMF